MKKTIDMGRKIITFLSVFSILAVSIFSVFTGVSFTTKAETPAGVEVWNGYDEDDSIVQFSGGDGSAVNPYIIMNGDQLFRMVYDMGKSANDEATYYKLGADIYLNDVTDYDKWGKDGFDMSSLNNWLENETYFSNYYNGEATIKSYTFWGNFDGDGHYIYGLYAQGYNYASFIPEASEGAKVKNVHFRNSYCVNTKNIDPRDEEGNDGGKGITSGNRTWYDVRYGSAGVIVTYCPDRQSHEPQAGIAISNCSVRDAYVEASHFTSAMVGAAANCYPAVKNCLIADVELNSTSTETRVVGVEGAVFNLTYGGTDVAEMEGVIVVGAQVYGATDRDSMWGGYKIPSAQTAYLFKSVYSNVEHKYSVDHYSYEKLEYTDAEINVVKPGYLKGDKAQEKLDLDWEYNWQVVEGDYPMPRNEYITPTGAEYYANGGPKASEDMWDGTAAKNFAAGTGTPEDPYLIETCEQFYAMVSKLSATGYYKIADGVTALYFNDVKGLSYSETMNMLKSNKMYKYNPGETNNFSGYFDGNGVTIYGIKSNANFRSGIIPQAGNATLKNFTVKNSYFNSTDGLESGSKTEGSAAVVADLVTNSTVNLRNIAVIDCYVHSNENAAGLVACSHASGCVFVDDCIVSGGEIMSDKGSTNHAAFVANSLGGTHIIKNAISLGVYPSADNAQSYLSTYKNVYTDYDTPSAMVSENISGVTKVEANSLKGAAVMTTAPQFAWGSTWYATEADLPVLGKHASVFGTPGTAWTGAIADAFAGGDGTQNNPYQIDTAERLAQAIMYCKPGAYYTITKPIIINDTTNPNWKDTAKQWFTSEDVSSFTGILWGLTADVDGLYYKDVPAGVSAGLVPVLGSGGEVRNIWLGASYLSGQQGAILGGIVGNIEDNARNTTVIRACAVEPDVVFEGAANVGGVVGRVGYTRLRMDTSVFKGIINSTGTAGGLVGEVIGRLEIKESISGKVKPFAADTNITAEAVYTDATGNNVEGITVLETSQMIGNSFFVAMDKLDVEKWTFISDPQDTYPSPFYLVKSFDGVQGEVWTGETASNFAGGTGTAEDPYLIATGEQLALAVLGNQSDGNKYYKMICDILLNDVADDLWQSKVGCNTWVTVAQMGHHSFAGHFDGDGYVVFGMYYNYKATPQNSYLGLFPRIGGSVTVKNVGISQAYIKAAIGDESVYAGGLFGMGSSFYDFYGEKIGITDTVNDEFLIPGEDTPRKLPSFTNCFVDHTCYFEANAVGGIGCPGGAVVVIRDCIVTASIVGKSDTNAGGTIGNQWSNGSRIYSTLSLPQTDNKFTCGTHQWVRNEANSCYAIKDSYYYGSMFIVGPQRITRPQWRVGEDAKKAMPKLDWENTWRTEPEGTPVLRIFDKPGRSASMFSDKTYLIPDVQINFITGTSELEVPPLVGKPYDSITLPTITRPGYIFTGWYSYPDFTLPYPYEYFLSRDINLYAGWKKNGIIQGFEDYTYSLWDCDTARWNYNKPGSKGGYMVEYAHTGTKSMQLLGDSAESADLLLNYEEWLTVGQTYQMTFWVSTDKADNPETTISLIHNNYPDYLGTEVASEPMVTVTGLEVGKWKQYSYNFTAKTNWASIRVSGNSSLFVDDFVIAPIGEIIVSADNPDLESINTALTVGGYASASNVNSDTYGTAPQTADTTTVAVLLAAIISCAIVVVVSKNNLVEVIDKE